MKFETITISILTALILLAGCLSVDEDSSFIYTSDITTTYGTAKQSPAPDWTNQPAGTIVYSLEGNPQGVSVAGATGVVTVGTAADARDTAPITVKATVDGTKEYFAFLTVTVTRDIATVTDFSIFVDDITVTAKSTDYSHSAVIIGPLTATTDYTLQITDSSNNVPGFMSIDANGDITIADSIAVSDGGTYTVTAAGTGSYSGTTSADFTLTVNSIDIATVQGFSISVGDKTATAKSTDSHSAVIAGDTLTATTDYTLEITDSSNNVPGFMSIDANGDITIADSIAVSDGGTYTVTAAGTGSYSGTTSADFTLTVNSIDIATVQGFSISVGDKTATAKSTDSHSAVIAGGPLTATTDYTLQITDRNTNEPNFMSIDANGVITINDSIAVSDGGTYTVTAAGTGSYSGMKSDTFTLSVDPKDIATVAGFSISVDAQTAPRLQESTFSVTINNAGLNAGTDYGLSIEKDGAQVNGVSINNDGLVSIANTIDIGDTGTYTVKATGKNNYTGEETVDFVLTVVYSIGDTGPAGGTIFYVNTDPAIVDWTYLEAASQDHDVTVPWGAAGTVNTGTAIGTGESNTAMIVTALGDNEGTAYAAKICSDYTVNHNGVDYDDWFLPSKDELNELYEQEKLVGNFDTGDWYWSSSEASADEAWLQYFTAGPQPRFAKSFDLRVRAVRAF